MLIPVLCWFVVEEKAYRLPDSVHPEGWTMLVRRGQLYVPLPKFHTALANDNVSSENTILEICLAGNGENNGKGGGRAVIVTVRDGGGNMAKKHVILDNLLGKLLTWHSNRTVTYQTELAHIEVLKEAGLKKLTRVLV